MIGHTNIEFSKIANENNDASENPNELSATLKIPVFEGNVYPIKDSIAANGKMTGKLVSDMGYNAHYIVGNQYYKFEYIPRHKQRWSMLMWFKKYNKDTKSGNAVMEKRPKGENFGQSDMIRNVSLKQDLIPKYQNDPIVTKLLNIKIPDNNKTDIPTNIELPDVIVLDEPSIIKE